MNKHRILAKLIQLSVPFLNLFRNPKKWPYSFNQLSKMENGTLGKELYNFLNNRGLEYLPKYEVHDAYHALLGYGTTVTEELKLQAFMFANGNATFAGKVLLSIGVIIFPSKIPTLKIEYNRGKNALPLKLHLIEELIERNLEELRSDLCIK